MSTSQATSSSSSSISLEEAEELKKLQEIQETLRKEWAPNAADTEEADRRSVYVGNVDYGVTTRGVEDHFKDCGPINRVTIPTDQYKKPKGFAYVEFKSTEAVEKAVLRTGTVLAGRRIKVVQTRSNKPGFKQTRGAPTTNGRGGHTAGGREQVIVKYVYVNGAAPRARGAGTFRQRPSFKPY